MISESIKVEKVAITLGPTDLLRKRVRFAIAMRNLSPQLSGTTILQLSDLHYDGIHLSETILQQAIALSN